MKVFRELALAALLFGGCASSAPPRGYLADAPDLVATLEADQAAVVRTASRLLAESWGFDIATADTERGVVETAEQIVDPTWRGAPLREFIYCGRTDAGLDHTDANPARISVRVAMRQQDLGATLLRIVVEGSLRTPTGDERDCRPTARMAEELIAGLRAAL